MPDALNRQNLNPEGLHQRRVNDLLLYSHAVIVDQPQKLIFISGQLARAADGSIVGVGDMRAQLRKTLENLRTALFAAGADLRTLVRTNTYVTDIEFYSHAMPTSTTVEVRRLAQPELLVEIDAIAALG